MSIQVKVNGDDTFLSKTLFIRGLQCHKSLYLHKYRPGLKDETSEETERIFALGKDVGLLAQQLFPGGVEVPFDGLKLWEQVEMTDRLIKGGTETIYEATFLHDGVFMKADILHRGKNGWELHEVKASTSVKEVYLNDISLQYYVITSSGLQVERAFVVYLNNQYMRNGDIDLNRLFNRADVTGSVKRKQPFISKELEKQRAMLKADEPIIDIGPHCSDPYDCDFQGHCWAHVPENSVFELRRRMAGRFSLYRQGHVLISDVPLLSLNDIEMRQEASLRYRKTFYDADEIGEFLASLWYPLYFLDFETSMSPVPVYDGTRPYENIPYQYSLHCMESENSELRHKEFLAEPGRDPRRELTDALLRDIPTGACVLAYNKSFEEGVLRSLARHLPAHGDRIENIIAGMKDLLQPFRSMSVYSWKQHGSCSLKSVLPAMIPGLDYDGLDIRDGYMAMAAYETMNAATDPDEIRRIRNSLLAYCKMDTLAMVRLYEKLRGGFEDEETIDDEDIWANQLAEGRLRDLPELSGYSEGNTVIVYLPSGRYQKILADLSRELDIDIYNADHMTDLIAVPSFMAVIDPSDLSDSDVSELFLWFSLLNNTGPVRRMPIIFTGRPSFSIPEISRGFVLKISDCVDYDFLKNEITANRKSFLNK